MVYRCIAPEWLRKTGAKVVHEGRFTWQQLQDLNYEGYNCYFLPNGPSLYDETRPVEGKDIDKFEWCFVDMDLKEGKWKTKNDFIDFVKEFRPTRIVDSGNGIHAYWRVNDLEASSYLRLQRRLCRKLNTDEAVCKIYQLLRVPATVNTKREDDFRLCEVIEDSGFQYTSEQLDKMLPPITMEDERYCEIHYNRTYGLEEKSEIDTELPVKFAKLLRNNNEVKEIWSGQVEDRSKAEYRLGHILFSNSFTHGEALSVLVNSPKASTRSRSHAESYARSIVDKIFTSEQRGSFTKLSKSVREILEQKGEDLAGTRFPCFSYIDATESGFRLSHVIGLVAGSGVGKTSIALNMFMGFVRNNPNYVHFFIPLEQPVNEISQRWQKMCGEDTSLYDKVELISNYEDDGSFRHLSLGEIKDYILEFQKNTGKKVGCVVIDHIAALKMQGENGENQRIVDICHQMKSFAIQTNTLLIMQSQAPREKAGIGDLELNKDAAYGSVLFESYCDYLISLWQPLKRCYAEGAPLVTAFKFCKIRHKDALKDKIKEDVPYKLVYSPDTGLLSELTQDQETSFNFFLNKATNKRKEDRKTGLVEYMSINWIKKN